MGPSWDLGDRTPVREPSRGRYGGFDTVDTIKGERGLPTLPLEVRYLFTLSEWLELARIGCPFDIQVHFGKCKNPVDFNQGWDKVVVLENADMSNYSATELGALEQGEDALVMETVDLNGFDYYEIKTLTMAEFAATQIVQEIIDVAVCDSIQCGACGVPSTGCEHVFALTLTAGGSPGLAAELIYSSDGLATLGETNVSTLAANEDPSAMACVGIYLVVVSNDSDSLHYAPIADILTGTEAWVEVATGIVAAGSPNDIFSTGGHTYICGDGGYVYHTHDVTAGVTVQDAGIASTEVLNAIHGSDADNVVAVGVNNAVIHTVNGGESWAAVTGPAVGVILNTIWMRSDTEWLIGDANGQLWYTRDSGVTWTEKTFPGSGAGMVRDIVFATPTVGYMAHDIAGPAGRILRTIDGGNSWYVLPEGTGAIPANDFVGALAAVPECPNVVYGGGLADDGTDGFLVKGV
jgi:hypothetical protein